MNSLITSPTVSLPDISFNRAAQEMKALALDKSLDIVSVTDEASQAQAVEAQKAVAEVLKLIEDARVEFKKPYLDFGRRIDAKAKVFCERLVIEATRVSRLVGDFQAVQLARQRAEEKARNEELTRLEREREEAKAKAQTIEEIEAIHERHQQAVQAMPIVPPAPRVEGQRVSDEWEFEVTDKHMLARMHPNLVDIVPRRSEIKEELKLGHKLYGIEARKVVVSGVRVQKGRELPAEVVR